MAHCLAEMMMAAIWSHLGIQSSLVTGGLGEYLGAGGTPSTD